MRMGLHPRSEHGGKHRHTHIGEAEIGVYAATSPRRPLALEAGIGKKDSPLEPSERAWPAHTDFSSCVKAPRLGSFVKASQRN